MSTKEKKFMSVKEAGRILNYSDTYIRMWINEGRVKGAMKVGNMWVIPAETVNMMPRREEG
jgi:excisionase family DNA binding protein